MTCIIGLEHEGHIYLGGDSAAVDDWNNISCVREPKVFHNGGLMMGYTTSFRMGQLLRHRFVPPKHERNISTMQYMVVNFMDAWRETLKESGWLQKEDEGIEKGGTFIVAHRGEMFTIRDNFQADSLMRSVVTVGCGGFIAQGAMAALEKYVADPEERIRAAFEIVADQNSGVRGPYTVINDRVK